MPFRIDCPHCSKGIRVPTKLAGKTSKCPSCEGAVLFPKIAVAIDPADLDSACTADSTATTEPAAAEPAPVVVVSPASTVSSRRGRRGPSSVLSVLLLLTFSLGGLAIGYVILDALGINLLSKLNKPNSIVQNKTAKRPTLSPPSSPPSTVIPDKFPLTPPQVTSLFAPAPVEPVPNVPIVELPKYVQLPSSENIHTTALLDLPGNYALTFTSIDPRLVLNKSTLRWSSPGEPTCPVAGLAIRNGKLSFRWLPEPPEEAIAAVHNSILRMQSPSGEYAIAMRSPVVMSPISIDLKKMVTRIYFECPYAPPATEIFFALTPDAKSPEILNANASCEKMGIRDECILWYSETTGVGTKVSFRSWGKSLTVDLHTRFRLPSGEELPLTISRNRKKRKVLEKLLESAKPAEKKAAEKELAALQEISALASKIDSAAPLSYRFFTVIDDVEVDLVVSPDRVVRLPRKMNSPQTLTGPIVEQEAIPLLKPASESEKSGWGNDFELIQVHAESTAIVRGRIQYNWFIKIRNSKSKHMAIDVFAKLLDASGNVLGTSEVIETALAPDETKVLKGQMDIDSVLESKVDSVFAHVKKRFNN